MNSNLVPLLGALRGALGEFYFGAYSLQKTTILI
jgi:hypothetical protein